MISVEIHPCPLQKASRQTRGSNGPWLGSPPSSVVFCSVEHSGDRLFRVVEGVQRRQWLPASGRVTGTGRPRGRALPGRAQTYHSHTRHLCSQASVEKTCDAPACCALAFLHVRMLCATVAQRDHDEHHGQPEVCATSLCMLRPD